MKKRVFNFLINVDRSRVLIILFFEIILGMILSFSSLLLFLKVTRDVFQNDFAHFDIGVSRFILQFRNPLLTDVMNFISFLGSAEFMVPVAILVIVLIISRYRHEAILFTITMFIGVLINYILKLIFKRPRPDIAPLFFPHTYSFPSGHAMNSFVFYALIAFYVFRFTRDKKISYMVSFVAILLIFLIGISRIYLGVHYPTDILGGFLAGFWWFVTIIVIEKTIVFFRLYKSTSN